MGDLMRKLRSLLVILAAMLATIPIPIVRDRESPPTNPVLTPSHTREHPVTTPTPMPQRTREPVMHLLWSDEGSGTGDINRVSWEPKLTDEWQNPTELQRYTDSRSNLFYNGSGQIVIRAIREDADGFAYTSGRLHGTMRFQYGTLEARIRIPNGVGTWPALWLLGDDSEMGWPRCGEIDIMEIPIIAGQSPMVNQGSHSPSADNGDNDIAIGVNPTAGNWTDDYHIYSLVWEPDSIRFYIDTVPTGEITRQMVENRGGEWVFNQRAMIPIINLAIGGWAGEPDSQWDSQIMLVDWVRVYQ